MAEGAPVSSCCHYAMICRYRVFGVLYCTCHPHARACVVTITRSLHLWEVRFDATCRFRSIAFIIPVFCIAVRFP